MTALVMNDLQSSPNRHILRFGRPVEETLLNNRLPSRLAELLIYIAQEGVTTTDLFRRQGNMTDVNIIASALSVGRPVNFNNYNFYTLASLIKKFLLEMTDGLFGQDVEAELLTVIDIGDRILQHVAIHRIITRLPVSTQQLTTLLLGIWFRIVNHSEYNTMSSEAVAMSVHSFLFHARCTDDASEQHRVQRAIQLVQILIDDFSVVAMLGRNNVIYFAETTRCRADRRNHTEPPCAADEDRHRSTNAFVTPSRHLPTTVQIRLHDSSSPLLLDVARGGNSVWNQTQLSSSASISAPEVNQVGVNLVPPSNCCSRVTTSLNRMDNVRRQQLIRMKKRSSWFLNPTLGENREDIMSQSFELRRRTLGAVSPLRSLTQSSAITCNSLVVNSSRETLDQSCP